jgi:hypothetical protein
MKTLFSLIRRHNLLHPTIQNYNIIIENKGTPIFITSNGLSPKNTYPYADGDLFTIFFFKIVVFCF